VKKIKHRKLLAWRDVCRKKHPVRHVAVERRRVKCYVDHFHTGGEARMIWRRRLFMPAT